MESVLSSLSPVSGGVWSIPLTTKELSRTTSYYIKGSVRVCMKTNFLRQPPHYTYPEIC